MAYWSSAISAAETATDRRAIWRDAVDRSIRESCDEYLSQLAPPVGDAIAYALQGGGKRLRGILVLAAYDAAGGDGDASRLAAAFEMIHAYSLVHDDLPCMDDDDMRRGRPTTHRVFGVGVATVAGAALIPIAARAAHDGARALMLPTPRCCTIVRVLMRAAGSSGMIGGQLLDLEAEERDLSRAELDSIHAAKTGALIASAAIAGGLAARAEDDTLAALTAYGANVGLAFQIMDDVLDVTSSTDMMGKTTGRDVALGKSTYPGLLGLEGAAARAQALSDDACDALRSRGMLTRELEEIADFVVSRTH
jgi:geranylgeranyl pyrophosphate synthase